MSIIRRDIEKISGKRLGLASDPAKPSFVHSPITTILKTLFMLDARMKRTNMLIPEDEWYIAENNDKAIIDREIGQRLLIRGHPQVSRKSYSMKCADRL